MKTASLITGIISISISAIFWSLILFTHFAQVGGDGSTAIALGLAWFFFGCPVILGLSIASLVTAFKKPQPVIQGSWILPSMKSARIVSIVSACLLVIPFIVGVFGPTIYNLFV